MDFIATQLVTKFLIFLNQAIENFWLSTFNHHNQQPKILIAISQ